MHDLSDISALDRAHDSELISRMIVEITVRSLLYISGTRRCGMVHNLDDMVRERYFYNPREKQRFIMHITVRMNMVKSTKCICEK